MTREPHVLAHTRRLVARAHAGGEQSPSFEELEGTQSTLRSFAAHPATDDALRARVLGALLVVDVLLAAADPRTIERLAG